MLFEHENFQGQKFEVGQSQAVESIGNLDNRASSVKVAPGCLLIAFDQPGLQGPTRTWGPGKYESLPSEWNDVISSARCNCRE